jgi:3D (Asp-Asp-Asp) domain-containing protein
MHEQTKGALEGSSSANASTNVTSVTYHDPDLIVAIGSRVVVHCEDLKEVTCTGGQMKGHGRSN